ncbi:MAG: hypothetical protein K0S67_13 [Nitrososphaeraceae archaeon]|jgi:hypothetical protein|nr:hypothetical protein [Nitrososphaeraceae archaeon]
MGAWILELKQSKVYLEYDEETKLCIVMEDGAISPTGGITKKLLPDELAKLQEFITICKIYSPNLYNGK